MCQQSKTGYTHCPHVHSDGDIVYCEEAKRPDINAACNQIKIFWKRARVPGICFWCEQKELDKNEGRKWGQGTKWGKEADWKRPEWLE